jgi:iron complex transport system substrate-binding protein
VRLPILLVLAACVASLLGCQESGFDESKETARPLKVQHALGETKVPGQASRPLTLTVETLDDILAVGVRPVRAAAPGSDLPPYLRRRAAGVPVIGPVAQGADLPPVKAAHPDLILGGETGQRRLYDRLSKIAATVVTDAGSGQWKLNVRLVGEALGRTNDAERLLIEYDGWVAAVRRLVRGKPKVAVARLGPNNRRLIATRNSFAGTILADVGVRQAHSVKGADLVISGDTRTWWGPGGILEARAALADLRRLLPR